MSGGIYYFIECDWCAAPADDQRYERRQDAVSARTRVSRYEGWLLKRPQGADSVLLCPECAADGR